MVHGVNCTPGAYNLIVAETSSYGHADNTLATLTPTNTEKPTLATPFPSGLGKFNNKLQLDSNSMMGLTLTLPQQLRVRKMIFDLHSQLKILTKPKKVALLVEHDNGLHIKLQCILSAKPAKADPAVPIPTKASPARAAPIVTSGPPTRSPSGKAPGSYPPNQSTARTFTWLSAAAPLSNVNIYKSSNNDDLTFEASEIESVLKTLYLNGLKKDDEKVMCDFLNVHFGFPTGFIQGVLSNNFDSIDWGMAESYTGLIL